MDIAYRPRESPKLKGLAAVVLLGLPLAHAAFGSCPGGLPISTNWIWSGDGREGGSQASLTVSGDTLSIAPVGFVFFTNPDAVYGDGEYCFRYYGSQFAFAWRIAPSNSSGGTALQLESSFHSGGDVRLLGNSWSGDYFRWHNGYSLCSTYAGISQPPVAWHDVSILDTGSSITVTLDGTVLDYFTTGSPLACFEDNTAPGYVGIGSQAGSVVYQGLSYSPAATPNPRTTWGQLKALYR